MKYSLTFISILALLGAIRSQANDVLPPRFNFDRYSKMVDHSPFAIATAAGLPETTPDFAKDLYLANAAHLPDGDLVTIASTSDQNFKKYLTTKEPVEGYGIANIEWSDRIGATKVTISKDGNFATLTFNETLLSQRTPNTPSQGQPNAPMAAVQTPQRPMPSRPGGPSLPASPLSSPSAQGITRPHSRGVIPRDPRRTRSSAPNRAAPQPDSN
ncbi:MAG TPA: hypothetical protein VHQ95_01075 [Pyrinomonadaceae bacterium]|jgi:hypothetical protein|nr:hypothetical protein [Pyrinomonadaceae bacterium]